MGRQKGTTPEEPSADRTALERLFEGEADPARPPPEGPPPPSPGPEAPDA